MGPTEAIPNLGARLAMSFSMKNATFSIPQQKIEEKSRFYAIEGNETGNRPYAFSIIFSIARGNPVFDPLTWSEESIEQEKPETQAWQKTSKIVLVQEGTLERKTLK